MTPNKSKIKPINTKCRAIGITLATETADTIDDMMELPEYRNNRSFVIETLITTHPKFRKFKGK